MEDEKNAAVPLPQLQIDAMAQPPNERERKKEMKRFAKFAALAPVGFWYFVTMSAPPYTQGAQLLGISPAFGSYNACETNAVTISNLAGVYALCIDSTTGKPTGIQPQ